MAVDLADAQRDEGNAEAPGQHAHLRDLEVLHRPTDEVRKESTDGARRIGKAQGGGKELSPGRGER